MNIAIIGSGTECVRIITFFKTHTYTQIQPVIVGFADPQGDPACLAEIQCAGIPFETDYRTFFERDDVNLIMDLTDDPEMYAEVLARKKKNVRSMNYQTSRLFLDMYRIYDDEEDEAGRSAVPAGQRHLQDHHERRRQRRRSRHRPQPPDPGCQRCVAQESGAAAARKSSGATVSRSPTATDAPCSERSCPCPLKETLTSLKPFSTTHVHLDRHNDERPVRSRATR